MQLLLWCRVLLWRATHNPSIAACIPRYAQLKAGWSDSNLAEDRLSGLLCGRHAHTFLRCVCCVVALCVFALAVHIGCVVAWVMLHEACDFAGARPGQGGVGNWAMLWVTADFGVCHLCIFGVCIRPNTVCCSAGVDFTSCWSICEQVYSVDGQQVVAAAGLAFLTAWCGPTGLGSQCVCSAAAMHALDGVFHFCCTNGGRWSYASGTMCLDGVREQLARRTCCVRLLSKFGIGACLLVGAHLFCGILQHL